MRDSPWRAFGDVVRTRLLLSYRADLDPRWPPPRRAIGKVPAAAAWLMHGLADALMTIETALGARRFTA